MKHPEVTVVSGKTASARMLGRTIAYACFNLPPSLYLIPDLYRRSELLPQAFRLNVEDAQRHGTAYTLTERLAVALWMPYVGMPVPFEPDLRLDRLVGDYAPRFHAFHATLHSRHPVGRPYHHLMILAVAGQRQRQGIGTKILAAHHDYLDATGQGAYLEAASLRLREVYRRFGYRDLGSPIILPDGATPMYPMWREPRGARHD